MIHRKGERPTMACVGMLVRRDNSTPAWRVYAVGARGVRLSRKRGYVSDVVSARGFGERYRLVRDFNDEDPTR